MSETETIDNQTTTYANPDKVYSTDYEEEKMEREPLPEQPHEIPETSTINEDTPRIEQEEAVEVQNNFSTQPGISGQEQPIVSHPTAPMPSEPLFHWSTDAQGQTIATVTPSVLARNTPSELYTAWKEAGEANAERMRATFKETFSTIQEGEFEQATTKLESVSYLHLQLNDALAHMESNKHQYTETHIENHIATYIQDLEKEYIVPDPSEIAAKRSTLHREQTALTNDQIQQMRAMKEDLAKTIQELNRFKELQEMKMQKQAEKEALQEKDEEMTLEL